MNVGELELHGAGFIHTLHECEEKLSGFLSKLGKIGGVIGGSFAGFEVLQKIMEGFESTLEMGAHLRDLSLATGQSAHDLVIFEHALELTGGSAADASNFIFKLQTALSGVNEEGKSTATALSKLGLSQKELRDKPLLEQIEMIQEGLGKIGSQSDKAAVIKDLFGFRFAAKAMPLLASTEGLEMARKQAEPLAAVMEKNAEAFHALDDAIKGMKLNLKEFFAGALQGVAPEATSIGDAIADIDFVGIGEAVGALLNLFIQLGKVFAMIAPLIDKASKSLEGMDRKMGGLGEIIGSFVGGDIGAKLGGALGDILGKLFGGGEAHHGFADQFRGLQDAADGGKTTVSSIQKIGGGGYFGSGGDDHLREAQRHTSLLQSMDRHLAVLAGGGHPHVEAPAV